MLRIPARRFLGALGLLLLLGFVFAGPASAHATLDDATPAPGATLAQSPLVIELRFSEAVSLVSGSIRLFDAAGQELSIQSAKHPDGRSSAVQVSPGVLPGGGYVVAWRAVSADGHPVHGAFTFRVAGGEAASPALIAKLLSQGGGDSSVGAALAVARAVAFIAVAVLIGGLLHSNGRNESTPRTRRVLLVAGILALLASVAALALSAPYGSGAGWGDVFSGQAWRDLFHSRSGWTWLLRIAMTARLVALTRRAKADRTLWAGAVAAAMVLYGAEAWSGHGATGRWVQFAFLLTVVHLGAVSAWFGGLVVLLTHAGESDLAARARRFSSIALISVGVITVSGVVQGWRQLGSVDALTSSTYGKLLIAKVAVVAAMLVAAMYARLSINDIDDDGGSSRMRNPIATEVLLGIGVFAFTSMLVVAQPGIGVASDRLFTRSLVQDTSVADITIEPLHPGPNTLHLTISSTGGSVLDLPTAIAVSVRLPSRDIGPISAPMTAAGPGHVIGALELPFRGRWDVIIDATYDRFTAKQFVVHVDIS
jgi:copper transport protein